MARDGKSGNVHRQIDGRQIIVCRRFLMKLWKRSFNAIFFREPGQKVNWTQFKYNLKKIEEKNNYNFFFRFFFNCKFETFGWIINNEKKVKFINYLWCISSEFANSCVVHGPNPTTHLPFAKSSKAEKNQSKPI